MPDNPFTQFDVGYDAATKQQGDIARYRGLQALSQMVGPQMGIPPGMLPQGPQANPPMPGPPMDGAMPPQGGPPMGGPQMGGQPPSPGGPPMGGPAGLSPMLSGGTMGGIPGQQVQPQRMPPPGGPPGMPPGGGGMPPGGGFQTPGQGPLSLPMVIQAIQKANPGAPPNVLAAAIDGMIPLMNMQSQQQWREQRLMMQEDANRRQWASLGEREQHDVAMETEAGKRTEEIQKRTQQGEEKLKQGQQKLDLENKKLGLQKQWRDRDYELKRAQFEQRIQEARQRGDQKTANTEIAKLRALIDAKHKSIGEQIKAATSGFQQMDKDAQKALVAEQEKLFKEDLDALRKIGGSSTPTGGTTTTPGPRAPAGTAIPGQAPGGPAPGAVMGGHKFKGGDPSKQENWEPVEGGNP